jgi:hypothetical protein
MNRRHVLNEGRYLKKKEFISKDGLEKERVREKDLVWKKRKKERGVRKEEEEEEEEGERYIFDWGGTW